MSELSRQSAEAKDVELTLSHLRLVSSKSGCAAFRGKGGAAK
ncbi:hypothetical protein [Oscillibacter sp.]|nr:hypothetical protein [Oscillibacter sp.]